MRRRLLALFTLLSVGCTAQPKAQPAEPPLTALQQRNQDALLAYLSAHDPETALAHLTPSYRPRMLEWDTALNPRRTIRRLAVNEDAAVVAFHEDNDFSRLIEHPGWDGTLTFTFDSDSRITASHFTPAPGDHPWGPYMAAALPWLREHHAEQLAEIYPDNHLKQDAPSARAWTALLREWRATTGRKPLD